MTITIHRDVYQGTQEWLQLRCGMLTASEMASIITPKKMELADNDKANYHLLHLMAQRITQHVEPSFQSYDMMRGEADEVEARHIYEREVAQVEQVGFITNEDLGFAIGCSPDGLVGDDGMIEIKSRSAKYQLETIMSKQMPDDFKLQVQTQMLVAGRKWCDFISYCGGLPMFIKRIEPDLEMQAAIRVAATKFHDKLDNAIIEFAKRLDDKELRLIPTEKKDYSYLTGDIK